MGNFFNMSVIPELISVIIAVMIIINAIFWFLLPFYINKINFRVRVMNRNLKVIKDILEKGDK